MWEYTEKVNKLFLHPQNTGEIENPDAVGEIGSIVCGDALKLTLKIDKKTDTIIDAKFQTFGCASAIASSSALTELIKGKTVDEALQVTNKDIAEYLGGLPKEKMHCSVMGQEALEAAVADYRGEAHPEVEEGEIVCKCFGVTDQKIRRVIKENGLRTVEDITNFTKAGGGCGDCIPKIGDILLDVLGKEAGRKTASPKKEMTNIKKIAMIQEVIEKEIRPRLQADGGDIELIDVQGNRVIISLRGMCTDCKMSGITIGDINKTLKELISDELVVEAQ
ncbi:MAG: Fe-S cluster assembly protein NifU [Thermodesulfovibrionia bacterium]|nr:Fe-S cluster assembly protein NifU [Thermodesulfovibrionia bacterium]